LKSVTRGEPHQIGNNGSNVSWYLRRELSYGSDSRILPCIPLFSDRRMCKRVLTGGGFVKAHSK
jgi:hypothetical protein